MQKILVFVEKDGISAFKVTETTEPIGFNGEDSLPCRDISDFVGCLLSNFGLKTFKDDDFEFLFVNCGADKKSVDRLYALCHDIKKVGVVSIETVLPWLVWNKKPLKAQQSVKVEFRENVYDISCSADNLVRCNLTKGTMAKVDCKFEPKDFIMLFEINAKKMIGGVHEDELKKKQEELRKLSDDSKRKFINAESEKKTLNKKFDNLKQQVSEYMFEPGNVITLGKWKKQKLAWIVLDYDKKKKCALLLCRDGVDTKIFDEDSNVWEKSALRKWLNETFYRAVFKDGLEGVNPGFEKTKDKISIMSEDEFWEYLADYEDMKVCWTTNNMFGYKKRIEKSWWLRSAGKKGNNVSIVNEDGQVRKVECNKTKICVRPFCWIDLDVLLGE